mmetsp:Transcript_42130/g.126095  ORF Transcript_42130/g.126095 Transcript_42130/m.126095 type:complete len:88 (+) Transcript_42130:106-369(+)
MYQEFLNLEEVEELARRSGLAKQTIDYYAGAAETKFSARENLAVFQRIKLLPRLLRNVSTVDTSTRLFGAHPRHQMCVQACMHTSEH